MEQFKDQPIQMEQLDWDIQPSEAGDMAFATYMQQPKGNPNDAMKQMRLLKKVDGVWKIAGVTALMEDNNTTSSQEMAMNNLFRGLAFAKAQNLSPTAFAEYCASKERLPANTLKSLHEMPMKQHGTDVLNSLAMFGGKGEILEQSADKIRIKTTGMVHDDATLQMLKEYGLTVADVEQFHNKMSADYFKQLHLKYETKPLQEGYEVLLTKEN
jgi:hypothetical protein